VENTLYAAQEARVEVIFLTGFTGLLGIESSVRLTVAVSQPLRADVPIAPAELAESEQKTN